MPGPTIPLAVLFAAIPALPADSSARTWSVGHHVPTIQAGIDSAHAGDDVLIPPGTFPEHDIRMKGGILLHSLQGPEASIVDARGAGRIFSCADFQEESVIKGLTLRNGRTADPGGGVQCVRANLRLQDCIVTGCVTEDAGGGVYAETSNLQIDGCRITGDEAIQTTEGLGGGGVACLQATLGVRECVIADCFGGTCGGGIDGLNSAIRIEDSEIRHNHALSCGGGISSTGPQGTVVERCTIISNRGECWGGGISCWGVFEVTDCLIVDNSANECGDGWALDLRGAGRITGCTVAANRGRFDCCVIYLYPLTDLSMERTVVAFHNGGHVFPCPSGVRLRCCDAYGNGSDDLCGVDLGGNFSADPLFCDMHSDDYSLDPRSPCLPGWHPQGVDCGLIGARDQGCPPSDPEGACCFPDGRCGVMLRTRCVDERGAFQGWEVICVPNPCQAVPVLESTWGRIKSMFR